MFTLCLRLRLLLALRLLHRCEPSLTIEPLMEKYFELFEWWPVKIYTEKTMKFIFFFLIARI